MNSLKTGLGFSALAFGLLAIVSCGGGSVAITGLSPEQYRTPLGAVLDLEKASDDAVLAHQLNLLREKKGDNLDWARFWQLLSQSRVTSRLVPKHQEALLSLHARNCATAPFTEFVRFVLHSRADLAFVTGTKRDCDVAIPPALTSDVFRYFVRDRGLSLDRIGDGDLEALVRFLTRQMALTSADRWNHIYGPIEKEDLKRILNRLVYVNRSQEVIDFVVLYQTATGDVSLSDIVASSIVRSDGFLQDFIKTRGHRETVRVINQLLSRQASLSFCRKARPLDNAFSRLLQNPFVEADGNFAYAFTQYLQLRQFLSLTSRNWKLEDQLFFFHRLESVFEKWWEGQPSQDKANYLLDSLRSFRPSLDSLELIWMAFRTVVPGNPVWSFAKKHLDEISFESSDGIQRIFLGRLHVLFADSMVDKKIAVDRLCALFNAEGMVEKALAVGDFKIALAKGMGAGCFSVNSSVNEPLSVATHLPLSVSSDTVVKIFAPRLTIEGSEVHLGIIDLSQSNFPKSSNILTDKTSLILPVLIGIPVGIPSEGWERGTHFIVVHLPYRTVPLLRVARELKRGEAGGELIVRANKPPKAFGFVSLGSFGELNPSADRSEVDTGALASWIKTLEKKTDSPQPHVFHHVLNSVRAQSLLKASMVSNAGPFVTDKNYLSLLSPYQRNKVLFACRNWKQMENEELDLNVCLTEFLLPTALDQLRKAFDRATKEDLDLVDSVHPLVWPRIDDSGERASGPRGVNGEFFFEKRIENKGKK